MGQKTSPLVLRKQYKHLERAQYFYGKSGNIYFHKEIALRSHLEQFFKRQKAILDTVTMLNTEKKFQIFLNVTLKKDRFRKIFYRQKKRNKRLKRLRWKLKKKKKKVYKANRKLKQQLNSLFPLPLFYKDYWTIKYRLQLNLITEMTSKLKELKASEFRVILQPKKFKIIKTINLQKSLTSRVLKQYLIAGTSKILKLNFRFYFLHKILKYLKFYSKSTNNLILINHFKSFLLNTCTVLPISYILNTKFDKLSFNTQQKVLKASLSKPFIKKYFFFQPVTKKNNAIKLNLKHSIKHMPRQLRKLRCFKIKKKQLRLNKKKHKRYTRLIAIKLIYQKKRIIKYYAEKHIKLYKKLKFKRLFNRKPTLVPILGSKLFQFGRYLFKYFKRLSTKPNLWTRYYAYESFTFRWFKFFFNLKPGVKSKHRPRKRSRLVSKKSNKYNKYKKRRLQLKKKHFLKKNSRQIRIEKQKRRKLLKKKKEIYARQLKAFYQKLKHRRAIPRVLKKRIINRMGKNPMKKKRRFQKRRKLKNKKLTEQYQTAKQFQYNWKQFQYLTFSTTNTATSKIHYSLIKTEYRKRNSKKLNFRFYKHNFTELKNHSNMKQIFFDKKIKFKKRPRYIRSFLRRKTKFFKFCYFLYFFNTQNRMSPLVAKFLQKSQKAPVRLYPRLKSHKRRKATLRAILKTKVRRVAAYPKPQKSTHRLLRLWKYLLKKHSWLATKKFNFFKSKKFIQKRFKLTIKPQKTLLKTQLQNQILTAATNDNTTIVFNKIKHALFWTYTLTSITFQPFRLVGQLKTFWKFITTKKETTLNIKTFLNKKILYFRYLAIAYTQFLKKKKYLSILFFKKLLKKILLMQMKQNIQLITRHSVKQTPVLK